MSIKEDYLMLDPFMWTINHRHHQGRLRPTQHCARTLRAIAGAIKEVA